MSGYKDSLASKWTSYQAEQKVKTEDRLATAEIEQQKRVEEQKAKVAQAEVEKQERIVEQETKDAQAQVILNQDYSQLFNEFRAKNGESPLTFDTNLNELAKKRAIEISQPGNFSHEGIIKYNLGENIAMLAYPSDSNQTLLERWANSPGHRSNMLSPRYTKTGFARVGKYAVQLFKF